MLKQIIKKIPGFNFLNTIRRNYDYNKDKKFYLKNYMYSKPITKGKIEYDMLLEIHKLEKGFAVTQKLRPFGIDKVKRIISDIIVYEENEFEKSFSYELSYSALFEYKKFYEEHNWLEEKEYKMVNDFLKGKTLPNNVPAGAYDLKKESIIDDAMIDYDKFVSSRKSVRNYSNIKLKKSDIEKAVKIAIKSPSACNRQMCKIYYCNSDSSKKVIEKYAQGLGLFELDNANYFVITFDVNANYFIGERNQGWFNSGLFTMNFINALHSLGIGTCCIQFGNPFKEEKIIKKELKIKESERVAVIVTAGYYDDISRIPYSTRKPLEEIYRER